MLFERKSGLERGPIVPLDRAPETKNSVAVTPEVKQLFDEMGDAFKTYRIKQDNRYDELQRRLDAALIDAKRPGVGNDPLIKAATMPKEWDAYLRKGHTTGIEEKALSVGSNPDGGYTVPPQLETRIIEVARNRSNIRAIAGSVEITSSSYEVVADPSDFDAAWVSETGGRPETNTAQLAKIVIPAHEMYAMPKATQTLLDDSSTNIEEWLSQRIADKLSRTENAAFVSGNGVGQPMGFLSYPTVDNGSWIWGKIGYIPTGQADFDTPSATVSGADDFIDTVYTLKADYRANANWVMNSLTASKVRKFKDATGAYIWQNSLVSGQPPMLLGYPVAIAEDMPNVGSGNFPVAFGDFRRGYMIVDRIGVRVLRDPYSAKPYVLFYTTKRVGGAVVNFDAIKLIKTAAS